MCPFVSGFFHLAYVSRLTHVVTCSRAPFLPMAEEHSIVWVSHILPIHAPLDECFDCFHFLAIISNAAVNICVWVCVWKYAFSFLGNAPRSGIAGSYGSSVTVFEELPNRGPKWLHFTFPPAVCVGSRFSTALSAPVLSTFLIRATLGAWRGISLGFWFDYFSLRANDVEHLSCACWLFVHIF